MTDTQTGPAHVFAGPAISELRGSSVPTPSDMLLAELLECRRLGRAIRHARRLAREEAGR